MTAAGDAIFVTAGTAYVIFTKAAGISAGGQAGVNYVQVNGQGGEAIASNGFSITPSVSLSHSTGFTDTELRVTGASFPEGTVLIRVSAVGTTAATEGTPASLAVTGGGFDTAFPIGVGDTITVDKRFIYGDNYIWVTHVPVTGGTPLAETAIAKAQKFVLTASVTVDDKELVNGDEGIKVEVDLGDPAAIVTGVTIGGTAVPFAPNVDTGTQYTRTKPQSTEEMRVAAW